MVPLTASPSDDDHAYATCEHYMMAMEGENIWGTFEVERLISGRRDGAGKKVRDLGQANCGIRLVSCRMRKKV